MLKLDLDATDGGVFDGLLGLVVEVVVLQAAMGRATRELCGFGSTRDPRGAAAAPVGRAAATRRAEGGQHRVRGAGSREETGPRREMGLLIDRLARSRNAQGIEEVFPNVSTGADTKANTLGAAAHLRLEIIVSLRMAASAEAPSSPIRLLSRLRARGRMGTVREYRRVNGH